MSKIVKRTLDVFELFAERKRPLSLSEISKLLGIPISSCHDVIQSLQERGYIYQLGSRGSYYPTVRMQQLTTAIAENDPILLRAEMALRELRDELDESVTLASVNGLNATYVIVFEPSHPLRFMVKVGDHVRSLYATSAGKATLGSLSEGDRSKALAKLKLEPFTEKTVDSIEKLKADIEASAQRGWYLNREESVPWGTTLSVPFSWNKALFIITVAGPNFRIEARLQQIADRIIDTCRRLENPGLQD